MFQPIKDLLPQSSKKFHLGPQVQAGLVCSKARGMIVEHFRDFSGVWEVRKFEKHRLTIACKNPSAASNLQMRSQAFLALCSKEEALRGVREIKIESL